MLKKWYLSKSAGVRLERIEKNNNKSKEKKVKNDLNLTLPPNNFFFLNIFFFKKFIY